VASERDSNLHTNQRMNSKEDENHQPSKKRVHSINDTNLNMFDVSKIEDSVTAIDNCIPLKILLIILSQGLLIGTLIIVGATS